MNILSFYFLRRTTAAAALLWLGLTILIGTLETIANLGERPLADVLLLSVLQTPRLALETLPFAVAIGAAASLQRMTETRELEAMRAAGLSLRRIALYAGGSGLLFAAVFILANELLLSPSESLARAVQGNASATGDIWLENDGTFLHAAELSTGGVMRDVAIYEPRKDAMRLITAQTAKLHGKHWLIENGAITELAAGRFIRTTFRQRQLDFPLPPASIRALIRRPREMSMRDLYATKELSGGSRFAAAFWQRLSVILALPLLAACAIWCIGGVRRRPATTALIATALAGACYFAAIICAQFALLLQMPPLAMLSVAVPIVALIAGTRRQFI